MIFRVSYRANCLAVAFGCALACLWSAQAPAEDYPFRPITLVVPYPAGGGVDALARLLAPGLSSRLGQQVIVENKGGAGGVLGARTVAKASPDGYTLALVPTGLSLLENAGYDLIADFSPVCLISSSPIVLVAPDDFAPRSVADVVALAKQKPKTINAGTTPPPSINYFAAELFKSMAAADISIVSYRGTAPLTNDLLGGHIKLGFNTIAPSLGNITAGKLRAIAVGATSRVPVLPDVPTVQESGIPGYSAEFFYGVLAPAGTPAAIVQRLSRELHSLINTDEIKSRIIADGGIPIAGSPEDYAANIAHEELKWSTLARTLSLNTN
jgi:tripartite-type tricarboxylate transporter receptor subunit TctC